MHKILILAVGLFIFQLVMAENGLKDSVLLDELTVTGTKFETSRKLVPLTVSQISQEDIQRSGQYNILSTLSTYVPGVFVTERNILGFGVATGGSGGINIRGLGGAPNTQILMLIDGHPQYQGIFGHPLSDAYVSSDVERVEVIRGPASVLYGSNAMGGVINIITKKQDVEGLSGNINAAYGSYNTQKYAGTIGYKKDKLNLFASVNHGRTDGIRENTDFSITNGYFKAGYNISSYWKAYTDVSIAKYDANDNGPVFNPSPFNINILRGKASLSVDNKYDKLQGSIKLYHNFGEHDLSDGFISSDRNSGLMFYQTYSFSPQTHITLGVDAKQYGGIANKGLSANIYKVINEIAAYGLIRHNFFGLIDLNAGMRYESNSVFGSHWVPMAGVSVQASPNTAFKASASGGFRSPTVMELYTYAPNPNLKPEKMMNYEVSWLQSFFGKKLNTELTAFMSNGENLIQVVGGPVPMRQNVGVFKNKGVEFSMRYHPLNNLSLTANYAFLDMKTPLLAAPRHQANLQVGYQAGIFNLSVQGQYVNGLNLTINPLLDTSYLTLNARVSVRPIKKLELFVSGQNLTNAKYQIINGYPMPGINFHGGFNWGW